MDSFKLQEVQRMSLGGNKPWKQFFDDHQSNTLQGRTFDECTIQERYDSDAGEEWKERLTAKVEGVDYVPGTRSSNMTARAKPANVTSPTTSRSHTPLASASSAAAAGPPTQKAQNEAYFSRMGAENANRPEGLHPNQGGKYAGFGSDPSPASSSSASTFIPGVDDFQKDPVAALTKGFGWLSSTVTKQAKTGYDGWVKPNMQKVCLVWTFQSS
jgi:ADP-ribosylation factor GTPase-activating protein 1